MSFAQSSSRLLSNSCITHLTSLPERKLQAIKWRDSAIAGFWLDETLVSQVAFQLNRDTHGLCYQTLGTRHVTPVEVPDHRRVWFRSAPESYRSRFRVEDPLRSLAANADPDSECVPEWRINDSAILYPSTEEYTIRVFYPEAHTPGMIRLVTPLSEPVTPRTKQRYGNLVFVTRDVPGLLRAFRLFPLSEWEWDF